MSYQLNQNSTPVWVSADALEVDPSSVPSYFRTQDSNEGREDRPTPQWEDIRHKYNHRDPRGDLLQVDHSILESYDLNDKWQNRIDPESKEEDLPWFLDRAYLSRTAHKMIRSNPFVPFTLRGLALVCALCGLGLACAVYHQNRHYANGQAPSTIMAIVVLTVAVTYLIYTIYDEFFGQPLGLRSGVSKMSFVFFDLVFIIFTSANLALAFQKVDDPTWLCRTWQVKPLICKQQRALVALLFVSVFMWVITFLVSSYRIMVTASHS